MVFENNCSVLIMLTRTVENNHIKCADYFNQRPGRHATFCGAGGDRGAQAWQLGWDVASLVGNLLTCRMPRRHVSNSPWPNRPQAHDMT